MCRPRNRASEAQSGPNESSSSRGPTAAAMSRSSSSSTRAGPGRCDSRIAPRRAASCARSRTAARRAVVWNSIVPSGTRYPAPVIRMLESRGLDLGEWSYKPSSSIRRHARGVTHRAVQFRAGSGTTRSCALVARQDCSATSRCSPQVRASQREPAARRSFFTAFAPGARRD